MFRCWTILVAYTLPPSCAHQTCQHRPAGVHMRTMVGHPPWLLTQPHGFNPQVCVPLGEVHPANSCAAAARFAHSVGSSSAALHCQSQPETQGAAVASTPGGMLEVLCILRLCVSVYRHGFEWRLALQGKGQSSVSLAALPPLVADAMLTGLLGEYVTWAFSPNNNGIAHQGRAG
jgi:hypothetical protein